MNIIIKPTKELKIQEVTVPGDKSISHRSVMFGAISKGTTNIKGFLTGEDCRSTIKCFRKLGVQIEENGTNVTVFGKGLHSLQKPNEILDVGNSGTTLRLMSGLLSWQNFSCQITGDNSIQKRPMDRVIIPLREMGANIIGKDGGTLAPITIEGQNLKSINYKMPIASAQVKSAIILASLGAEGETIIEEPMKTRDHTEILLNYLGANIITDNNKIISRPINELTAKDITVPGDISSAAYFIVAGLITNSTIKIMNVNVNPTRTGIISALQQMGANIEIENTKEVNGELTANIIVKKSTLKATKISGEIIPKMIDEIPIFAVAALFAEGETIIADAQELKVKESNRIKTMTTELKKMGASIEETDDGMIIKGSNCLKGAEVESYLDHRVAMSLTIAALTAKGETLIKDADCVDISFPKFFNYFK